jgi:hypothetical protein
MSPDPVPASPNTAVRDWIVRTIPPNQIIDISGYGVEILISDPADQNGRLLTSMDRDNFDSPFAVDGFIPTVPGMRRSGRFRFLKYIPDLTAPNVGQLRLRVMTSPACVWSDVDPGGKQRTIFFARNVAGGLVLATTVAQNVVDFDLLGLTGQNGIHQPDRFWTEEVFESRMYWYGWIVGSASFKVNVFTQNNPNDLGEGFHGITQWTAVDKSAAFSAAALAACGGAASGSFMCDFTTGTQPNQTGNTASCRQPIPAGRMRMNIENLGAGNATFYYMIGACSHL